VVTNLGSNYFQVTFVRRPAETGVTYHVQTSADLDSWSDIATYAGANIVLTSQAAEISRVGAPDEQVTVRETSGLTALPSHYLRVSVTRP
jgi:hypothetical protein